MPTEQEIQDFLSASPPGMTYEQARDSLIRLRGGTPEQSVTQTVAQTTQPVVQADPSRTLPQEMIDEGWEIVTAGQARRRSSINPNKYDYASWTPGDVLNPEGTWKPTTQTQPQTINVSTTVQAPSAGAALTQAQLDGVLQAARDRGAKVYPVGDAWVVEEGGLQRVYDSDLVRGEIRYKATTSRLPVASNVIRKTTPFERASKGAAALAGSLTPAPGATAVGTASSVPGKSTTGRGVFGQDRFVNEDGSVTGQPTGRNSKYVPSYVPQGSEVEWATTGIVPLEGNQVIMGNVVVDQDRLTYSPNPKAPFDAQGYGYANAVLGYDAALINQAAGINKGRLEFGPKSAQTAASILALRSLVSSLNSKLTPYDVNRIAVLIAQGKTPEEAFREESQELSPQEPEPLAQQSGGVNIAGGSLPLPSTNGFATQNPVIIQDALTAQPLAIAGEAGPETITVQPNFINEEGVTQLPRIVEGGSPAINPLIPSPDLPPPFNNSLIGTTPPGIAKGFNQRIFAYHPVLQEMIDEAEALGTHYEPTLFDIWMANLLDSTDSEQRTMAKGWLASMTGRRPQRFELPTWEQQMGMISPIAQGFSGGLGRGGNSELEPNEPSNGLPPSPVPPTQLPFDAYRERGIAKFEHGGSGQVGTSTSQRPDPRLALPTMQSAPAKTLALNNVKQTGNVNLDQVLATVMLNERARLEASGVSPLLSSEIVRNRVATKEGRDMLLSAAPSLT